MQAASCCSTLSEIYPNAFFSLSLEAAILILPPLNRCIVFNIPHRQESSFFAINPSFHLQNFSFLFDESAIYVIGPRFPPMEFVSHKVWCFLLLGLFVLDYARFGRMNSFCCYISINIYNTCNGSTGLQNKMNCSL